MKLPHSFASLWVSAQTQKTPCRSKLLSLLVRLFIFTTVSLICDWTSCNYRTIAFTFLIIQISTSLWPSFESVLFFDCLFVFLYWRSAKNSRYREYMQLNSGSSMKLVDVDQKQDRKARIGSSQGWEEHARELDFQARWSDRRDLSKGNGVV